MALSKTQQDILTLLQIIGTDPDEIQGILLLLKTSQMQEIMLEWLIRREPNPPTPQEALEAAVMIYQDLS